MPYASFPTRQLGRNGPTVSAIGFGATKHSSGALRADPLFSE